MRSKTTLAGVLAAALAVLGEAHAAEQRCNELGEACVCSEPLNNLDSYTVSTHDPSDSTTKECGEWDAALPGSGTASFPVPFPPGATLQNVLFMAQTAGAVGKLRYEGTSPRDLTNQTLCVRSYRNYGATHAPPGNIKIARMGSLEGVSWQSAWSANGGPTSTPHVNWISLLNGAGVVDCALGHTGSEAEQLRFTDCQSHWCRFEICVDHNGATGEFDLRAEWAQVGGTKKSRSVLGAPGQYGPDCVPERGPSASVIGDIVVAEFADVCCPATPGGALYASSLMVAQTRYDPQFWIGAAREIENVVSDR
jgi:hypothetical protein